MDHPSRRAGDNLLLHRGADVLNGPTNFRRRDDEVTQLPMCGTPSSGPVWARVARARDQRDGGMSGTRVGECLGDGTSLGVRAASECYPTGRPAGRRGAIATPITRGRQEGGIPQLLAAERAAAGNVGAGKNVRVAALRRSLRASRLDDCQQSLASASGRRCLGPRTIVWPARSSSV